MTLNATGPISLGGATTGQSINLELRVAATTQISLNDATVRFLLGASSGAISLSNAYGKTYGTPVTITSNFKSVASNGTNTLVAVGDSAAIVRSPDGGKTWIVSSPPSGVTTNLVSISYVNGYFVAVGPAMMIYSTDGVTWTRNTTVTAATVNAVAYDYNAGRFIVAGYSTFSYVYYSTTISGTFNQMFVPSSAGSSPSLSITGTIRDYWTVITSGVTRHYLISSSGQFCGNANGGATGSWYAIAASTGGSLALCNRMAWSGSNLRGIAVGTQMRALANALSIAEGNYTLNGVKAADDTNFVSVGPNGSILSVPCAHGSSYAINDYVISDYSISGSTQTLYDFDGNSTYGYVIVGSSGVLLYTTNYAGGTWTAAATYTIP